jgi:hypothetical protein
MSSFWFLPSATLSLGSQITPTGSFNIHLVMLFSPLHVRSSYFELEVEPEDVGCVHLSTSSLFLLQCEDAVDMRIVLTVLIAADVESFLQSFGQLHQGDHHHGWASLKALVMADADMSFCDFHCRRQRP